MFVRPCFMQHGHKYIDLMSQKEWTRGGLSLIPTMGFQRERERERERVVLDATFNRGKDKDLSRAWN